MFTFLYSWSVSADVFELISPSSVDKLASLLVPSEDMLSLLSGLLSLLCELSLSLLSEDDSDDSDEDDCELSSLSLQRSFSVILYSDLKYLIMHLPALSHT